MLKTNIEKYNILKDKYRKQDEELVTQIFKTKQNTNYIFLVEILLKEHKMIYEKLI